MFFLKSDEILPRYLFSSAIEPTLDWSRFRRFMDHRQLIDWKVVSIYGKIKQNKVEFFVFQGL